MGAARVKNGAGPWGWANVLAAYYCVVDVVDFAFEWMLTGRHPAPALGSQKIEV